MKTKRSNPSIRRPKARAADLVGQTKSQPRVRRQWQRYYKRLLDLRAYLLNQKDGLAKDAAEEKPIFSMHMADAGTDEFDRDFALSMMSSEQDALYEIDLALNRIQNGTYGTCELTGKTIEPKRLDAIPWARFSAEAERQLEKEGGIALARLGPRREVPKRSAAEVQAEEEEEEKEEQAS